MINNNPLKKTLCEKKSRLSKSHTFANIKYRVLINFQNCAKSATAPRSPVSKQQRNSFHLFSFKESCSHGPCVYKWREKEKSDEMR